MRGNAAQWSWLGDPHPGDGQIVARALDAEEAPSLTYGTTVWVLVRDPGPAIDGSPRPGLCLHLRFVAESIMVGAWMLTPVWLVRRARLKRAVQTLRVSVTDASGEVTAAEQLLSEAAEVIDRAVA
jgi:hypothetical protein